MTGGSFMSISGEHSFPDYLPPCPFVREQAFPQLHATIGSVSSRQTMEIEIMLNSSEVLGNCHEGCTPLMNELAM